MRLPTPPLLDVATGASASHLRPPVCEHSLRHAVLLFLSSLLFLLHRDATWVPVLMIDACRRSLRPACYAVLAGAQAAEEEIPRVGFTQLHASRCVRVLHQLSLCFSAVPQNEEACGCI